MSDYFIYYFEANMVCFILFGIMLTRDLLSRDRQERQIKYDHALIAFMAYFVSDTIWAAVIAGILPSNRFTVLTINFANYVAMAMISFMWLRFVMAVENIPNREKKANKFFILLPHFLSTVALIVTYLVAPQVLFDEKLNPLPAVSVFLIGVPIIYIATVLFYTIQRAGKEKNPAERKKHLYIGFYPLIVVGCGIFQVIVLPDTPIFCFGCTVLMLIFYIQSMESQISVDPLTGLNNRGALHRFIAQDSNLRREARTFIIMLDVNDFKSINDSYGHAEGDHALVIVADSLKKAAQTCSVTPFLGRFGGDEFVIIAHPQNEEDLKVLVVTIRETIHAKCESEKTPYKISIGIGYDEFLGEQDTFQKCMQRADHKLYLDKEYCKLNGRTSA